MHDGVRCLVSDHLFYTAFHDALWDTLSQGYDNLNIYSDNTMKWYMWVILDTAWDRVVTVPSNLCGLIQPLVSNSLF